MNPLVRASAGVNIASLFSQFGVNHAKGGPFVPSPRAGQPAAGIVADRPAPICGSAWALTLSTPLEHFQAGSRFGPRRDPFTGGTGRWHTIPGETPPRRLCRRFYATAARDR